MNLPAKNLNRHTLALAALVLLGARAPSVADTVTLSPVRTDPDGISGFDVFDLPQDANPPKLIWWKTVTETSSVGRVRRANVWSTWSAVTKDLGCCILQSDYSNAVAYGDVSYYFGVNGQLSSKGLLQNVLSPATILPAPPLPPDEPGSYLELFDNLFFWSAYTHPHSQLYSMPKDASQAPTLLCAVAGRIQKIKGLKNTGILNSTSRHAAFLTESGRIYILNLDHLSAGPALLRDEWGAVLTGCRDFDVTPGGGWTSLYAVMGDTSLFVASPPPPGRVLVYDAGTGSFAMSRVTTGDFQVVDVAVGPGAIWTLERGNYACTAGSCGPTTTRIVTYKPGLANPEVLSMATSPLLASLSSARHLIYTSQGFMLLRDDTNTIYVLHSASDTLAAGKVRDPEREFRRARRGDANNDGRVNEADAESILENVSLGRTPFACAVAADSNADGRIDIQDATYLLIWLYAKGPPPPSPGPYDCGEIELDDPDSCQETICETSRR